jgi:hypothetical protein
MIIQVIILDRTRVEVIPVERLLVTALLFLWQQAAAQARVDLGRLAYSTTMGRRLPPYIEITVCQHILLAHMVFLQPPLSPIRDMLVVRLP